MVNVIVGDKTINDIELFVFDKDGTLIDLYNYWKGMIELRAKDLCSFCGLPEKEHRDNLMSEMGIDLKGRRLKPEGPVGILPRAVVQKTAEDYLVKVGCQDVSKTCYDIFKKVDEKSLSLLDDLIKPIDGAICLLKKIKEKKSKIAIATTDKTERAELAVDFLGARELVDVIVGADMVSDAKPAPDMLKLIGKRLSIGPLNSLMIGDAKTDIQMGANAGFKASVAVLSGLTDKRSLLNLTTYVVDDISKIKIG